MRPVHILITCEHAGNKIPKAYSYLFHQHEDVLKTHRGIDIGAKQLAHDMSDRLRAKLVETDISRLLVDCNRSTHNPQVFSEFTSGLKPDVKRYLLDHYYYPHRRFVEHYITEKASQMPVLHVSVHSFTPVWNGEKRKVDVALLFDENRTYEAMLCDRWVDHMSQVLIHDQVRKNEPYKGTDDGLTTYLRTRFTNEHYMGIEVEVNQKWMSTPRYQEILNALVDGLESAIDQVPFVSSNVVS